MKQKLTEEQIKLRDVKMSLKHIKARVKSLMYITSSKASNRHCKSLLPIINNALKALEEQEKS